MELSHAHEAHEEENNERWLVSYADYVTLLFAFFVVMFASSNADRHKAQQVSESVRRAYSGEKQSGGGAQGETKAARPAAAAQPAQPDPGDLQEPLDTLMRELDKEIKAGKVVLRTEARGLVISLQETAFFQPGEDVVAPAMAPAVFSIAKAVQKLPNAIRLEGHTDSTPIHNSRFRSNWHLSSARALAMLEFLAQQCGVPTERMSVAGYSDTMPVDSNTTPEGRSRNRRVDVVVITYAGGRDHPSSGAGAPAAPPKTLPGVGG